MNKKYLTLLALTSVAIFFLVYGIHWDYHLPYHIDEWHHISEAIRLGNYGEYFDVLKSAQANRFSGVELGFHFFLFLLSFAVNLVGSYQFLPAVFAVLSALALFFVTYKKTGDMFWIGWLAMVFFASIRSNVNITGLWFFTPLTFSLPFIFLYFYLISEGIAKQDNRMLFGGLAIMLLLVPTHSISVIFALPALAIYILLNWKTIAKQPWILGLFPYIAFIGLFFYAYVLNLGWAEAPGHLISSLQFPVGWGVVEENMPIVGVYSWFGFLTAFLGIGVIIARREWREYALFLLWPATVFVLIALYLLTGVSYFSPYQRNLYYFAIALPFFSAIGVYCSAIWLWDYLPKLPFKKNALQYARYGLLALGFVLTLIILFLNYYKAPPQFELYKPVSADDLAVLAFLSDLPRATVMAPPLISSALFPVARMDPMGDSVFYGNPEQVLKFFMSDDCKAQGNILAYYNVRYVISPFAIDCDFGKLIMSNAGDFLYQVR